MTQDRILDKLRKVLAMTQSPVEAEAQTAAEMLQRLLTQYNLDMADLEQRGAAKPAVGEQAHDLGKAAFRWKLDLANVIADHYYCASLIDWTAKTVRFVGRPDNVESLKLLYNWLIEQIKAISASERKVWQEAHGEHVDPLRWQVNFGLGVASRIGVRLAEIRDRMKDDTVTALVLSHKSEISDYMEEQYGRRIDGKPTKQEQKWQREREEREAAMQKLKETDLDAYYAARPWERPLSPEEQIAQQKAEEKAEKRYQRNAARRTGRAWRPRSASQVRQDDQAYSANLAGRDAAGKVNLEPFLKGNQPSAPKNELK